MFIKILDSVAAIQMIHEQLSKLSESDETYYLYDFLINKR